MANELTLQWHRLTDAPLSRVSGDDGLAFATAFYSPDHPSPFTPNEAWASGLTSLDDVKRYGFIGVFDASDERLPKFEKWIAETAPHAERMVMTTRRFTHGKAGPAMTWNVYIAQPGK